MSRERGETGDLFGKAQRRFSKSHLKNQCVDCSRIPSAYYTLKEKYAEVAEESLRLSMKERVEENETVGTQIEVGGRKKGRVRQGEAE